MPTRLLIAEDNPGQRRYLSKLLEAAGYAVEAVGGGEPALARLLGLDEAVDRRTGDNPGGADRGANRGADRNGGRDRDTPRGEEAIDLLLLDVAMPDLDGLSVLRRLRGAGLTLPIIVLTSDGSVARAVEAMRAGATDFLVKPVGPERLQVSIRNALSLSTLSTDVRRLAAQARDELSFDDLIALSPATRAAIALARRAARSGIPLLIEGESGTGKEVFARAVHGSSERAGHPFVAVNCGALPAALVESILFGHEKGAFTGASTARPGLFRQADGGTLFLDELGELPLDAQVKLLRALQTGEVDPVGATRPVRVDVRLISATNRDLLEMVGEGSFREDLYYRIGVLPLALPPLRERREDIPALAEMFLTRFAALEGVPIDGFREDARKALVEAPWPGNVRQMENVIRRAVVLCEGARIAVDDLRLASGPRRRTATAPEKADAQEAGTPAADPFLNEDGHVRRLIEVERAAIVRALTHYDGRMTEVARRLGIGRSTLYRKVAELAIDMDGFGGD